MLTLPSGPTTGPDLAIASTGEHCFTGLRTSRICGATLAAILTATVSGCGSSDPDFLDDVDRFCSTDPGFAHLPFDPPPPQFQPDKNPACLINFEGAEDGSEGHYNACMTLTSLGDGSQGLWFTFSLVPLNDQSPLTHTIGGQRVIIAKDPDTGERIKYYYTSADEEDLVLDNLFYVINSPAILPDDIGLKCNSTVDFVILLGPPDEANCIFQTDTMQIYRDCN